MTRKARIRTIKFLALGAARKLIEAAEELDTYQEFKVRDRMTEGDIERLLAKAFHKVNLATTEMEHMR